MKNTVLFCTGLSGSGKSYFAKNTLPSGLFYNLRSLTTRPMRQGESDGNPYFFVDETEFERARLVTRLWVNEAFWAPGKPKWLYGVPESEVLANLNRNLLYDVIQPKYARQMIDWFCAHGLDAAYNFRVAYFLAPENNFDTASRRANMPNDAAVRQTNTCNPEDFLNANLEIDYLLKPIDGMYSQKLSRHIRRLAQNMR